MEDYEALTPEEIEMERRARRRKREARERRRKKRIRRIIIRCSILLVLLILILVGIVKLITGAWKHFHKEKESAKKTEQTADISTQQPTTEEIRQEIDENILAKELPADRETALAILKEQAGNDSDIRAVYENAAIYPDKLLQHLAVNSEMKQFALDYPAKVSIVFDGEFTVSVPQGEVPLFLQFDEDWGYADYGTSLVAINGSGPACLSMAYTYLKQDGSMNPIKIADFSMENGYLGENNDTFWTLMTDGATSLGLTSEEVSVNKDKMTSALEDGKLLICSLESGDFTKTGGFILIHSYENGLFYVKDPTSEARSGVGWDYDRLSTQISNMWAIGAAEGATEGATDDAAEGAGENITDDKDADAANETDAEATE